jgi:cytochrome b6-f complex iron-sulfur subunit
MKSSLPIADEPIATARCGDCSRRELLRGLGAAAVGGLLLSGCPQSGPLPTARTTTCGSQLCIDITDPANTDLATTGGALLVDTSRDTIMVIRNTETDVIAISAVCTHAGCVMGYIPNQHVLDCGCHGSQFSEDGSVIQGPARRALKVYPATLSGTTITLTA